MLRSTLYAATCTVIAALLAGAPVVAGAQQATGCEDAAARVNGVALPRVGAPQWNDWMTLTGCGSRGATIVAGALNADALRTETELTRLDHLTSLLDGWFHPSLIASYEALLRAPDASYAVRLRAMWLLSGLLAPNVDVAGPLQGYMSARCETYDRMTALRDAPNTMPAQAYDQARDALAYAANDRSAPEYVRTTARCWDGVVANGMSADRERRDERAVAVEQPAQSTVVIEQPIQPTVVIQRPVRVVYECDNRFVFYNEAGYDLAVRYGGYGSGGVLRVAHGGPYVWVAARFGPVRFWVGDQEVWYGDATYRPCGGRRVIFAPVIYPWQGWRIGLGMYIGHRYVSPRYLTPRVYRPIIVGPPRRVPDGRNDPRGRDERGGRGDEPRGGGNAAPRGPARNEPAPPPRAAPRPEPRPEPRQEQPARPPRFAVPRPDGDANGRAHGSVPLPRATEERHERFTAPNVGPAERPAPPPSAGPVERGGRDAPKSGDKGGDGGRRAVPSKGKPGN